MVKMPKTKDKYMQWLNLNTATQTVADTSITAETKTPCEPEIGLVMIIHEIDYQLTKAPMIDGALVEAVIASRDNIADVDIRINHHAIIDMAIKQSAVITTGGDTQDNIIRHVFPTPFIIAHPSIWLYALSLATTVANSMNARIGFTFAKVSPEEFWQALAQY